ncbi:energy-coupling factor transporter ATPase [bacterium]|nr:energy-coupling factor transporter ATPase [bacterium]
MAVIELRDVSFTYDGERDALSHVSLTVERGAHVVVLGRNGSGKSTLARCVNGLVVPDEGRVLVDGRDTADPDDLLEIRRHTGMVFQNPDDQMVASVVADDVAFGPENLGVPQPGIAALVDEALRRVGMTAFAQADPAELSGGQRQRVAVAGALAMRPDILLLDEPASMLDPAGRADLARIVAGLHADGITVLHVTHLMEDALAADRVVVMDRGTIAMEGAPDQVFARGDELEALGLELPFAQRLARRLRALGVSEALAPDTPRLRDLEEALCQSRSSR